MTLTIVLGNKISGKRDYEPSGTIKYYIYYIIYYNHKKYYVRTQYRVLPYDFVGKENKITRIPLYNELIKEELAKYHELKEKYGEKDEVIALRNFRAWMEKRNEI